MLGSSVTHYPSYISIFPIFSIFIYLWTVCIARKERLVLPFMNEQYGDDDDDEALQSAIMNSLKTTTPCEVNVSLPDEVIRIIISYSSLETIGRLYCRISHATRILLYKMLNDSPITSCFIERQSTLFKLFHKDSSNAPFYTTIHRVRILTYSPDDNVPPTKYPLWPISPPSERPLRSLKTIEYRIFEGDCAGMHSIEKLYRSYFGSIPSFEINIYCYVLNKSKLMDTVFAFRRAFVFVIQRPNERVRFDAFAHKDVNTHLMKYHLYQCLDYDDLDKPTVKGIDYLHVLY